MATASEAVWITPSVAPASDSTRLACRSSANRLCRKAWTASKESGFLDGPTRMVPQALADQTERESRASTSQRRKALPAHIAFLRSRRLADSFRALSAGRRMQFFQIPREWNEGMGEVVACFETAGHPHWPAQLLLRLD